MFGLRRWDCCNKLSNNASTSRPRRPALMMVPSVSSCALLLSMLLPLLLLFLFFSLQKESLLKGVGTANVHRHPLTTSLRRRLDGNHVRFLAIGGPSTWGFGLDNPDASGYSAILSDGNVHNAGQLVGASTAAATPTASSSAATKGASSGGRGWPTLASLCTQSIVGDTNIYDIILIETSYHDFHDHPSADVTITMMDEKNDDDQTEEEIPANYNSLSLLASRLRKRFPFAKIIFVQLWHPSQMMFLEEVRSDNDDDNYDDNDDQEYYYSFKNTATTTTSDGIVVTFDQWRANQQTEPESSPFWGSEKCSGAIQKHEWSVSARREKAFDLYLNHLASEIQAVIYKLPRPTGPTRALLRAQQFFLEKERPGYEEDDDDDDDGLKYQYSLSSYGHNYIANAIRSQILNNGMMTMILNSSDEWRNRIGGWGGGDSCQVWYETNRIDFGKLTYRGLSLRSFSKPGSEPKYALELSSSSEMGGTITITNPFPEARMVHLTYMTTSSFAFSNKVYPSTKVQLSEKSSVVLDPRHEDKSIRHQIPRTTAIGRIPGENARTAIRLDSLENAVSPFRVVGVSLLFPQQQQNYDSLESANARLLIGKRKIPTEFSLITEPTHVGELHTYADLF